MDPDPYINTVQIHNPVEHNDVMNKCSTEVHNGVSKQMQYTISYSLFTCITGLFGHIGCLFHVLFRVFSEMSCTGFGIHKDLGHILITDII